jgi:hypothetical protein
VRVENSLFTGSSGDRHRHRLHGSGSASSARRGHRRDQRGSGQNNTAVGNKNRLPVLAPGPANYVHGRSSTTTSAYDNRVSDLFLQTAGSASPTASSGDTQSLTGGGAFRGIRRQQPDVTPQLSATFQPIEPSSPVINNGDDTPAGGCRLSDYNGASA